MLLTPRNFAAPVAAFCAIGLLSFQGPRQIVKQDEATIVRVSIECPADLGAAACAALKDRAVR